MMSGFITKPVSGWIHSDSLISKEGANYAVRYVGCLEVKSSMKMLDFKTRTSVAKECINRVCEAAGLKTVDKKRKPDKEVQKAVVKVPNMEFAGTNVNLNVSSSSLTLTSLETGQIIASHDMPRISFASGGDCDTLDFVAYIAKDVHDWRACYVLECGGGLSKSVISTIGQAFELRFKQFIRPDADLPFELDLGPEASGDTDIDYYNDLPGKVPPDVASSDAGPPPVPPLPTVTKPPFTTLPPVQSPNLIDFSAEPLPFSEFAHHDYVNEKFGHSSRERDVFDMQPFTQPQAPSSRRSVHLSELENEIWFHGEISRVEAERLLRKDGDFLVRESPNSDGQFVLSGMEGDTKKHLLLIDPDGNVRTKDRLFNSVSHLVKFHSGNNLPIVSAESSLSLRKPIPRSA